MMLPLRNLTEIFFLEQKKKAVCSQWIFKETMFFSNIFKVLTHVMAFTLCICSISQYY